jgi:hypothetical protein
MRADISVPVRLRVHPITGPDEVTCELLNAPESLIVEDASVSNHKLDEVVVRFMSVGEPYRGGEVGIVLKVQSAEETLDAQGHELTEGDEDEAGDESDEDDFFEG